MKSPELDPWNSEGDQVAWGGGVKWCVVGVEVGQSGGGQVSGQMEQEG